MMCVHTTYIVYVLKKSGLTALGHTRREKVGFDERCVPRQQNQTSRHALAVSAGVFRVRGERRSSRALKAFNVKGKTQRECI